MRQTSSGLRVTISSADLRWTSASRSRFFGNRLRLAWIIVFDAWASCHWRTARSAASQPRWNSGVISELGTWSLLLLECPACGVEDKRYVVRPGVVGEFILARLRLEIEQHPR